jgi:chromosome segregation ATPase
MRKKKPTLKSEITRLEGIFTSYINDLARRIGEVNESREETQAEVDDLMVKVAQLRASNKADGPIWQSALGPISMRAMTDSHLANAIKFLEGLGGNKFTSQFRQRAMPKLPELKAEKKRREMMAAEEKKYAKLPFALDPKVGQPKGLKPDMNGWENPSIAAQQEIAVLVKQRNIALDDTKRLATESADRKRMIEALVNKNGMLAAEIEDLKKHANLARADAQGFKEMEATLKRVAEELLREIEQLRQDDQDDTDLREDLESTRKTLADMQTTALQALNRAENAERRVRELEKKKHPYSPFTPGCE